MIGNLLGLSPFWYVVAVVGFALVGLTCILPAAVLAFERLRSLGVHERRVFLLAVIGCTLYGGAKHFGLTVQTAPSGISVHAYVPEDHTNTWDVVEFAWSAAADTIVPPDAPLLFERVERGTTNAVVIAENVYSDSSNSISTVSWPMNPTCYVYRVTTSVTPTRIEITDFRVRASETSRSVTVSFTAPTNLYEAVAHVYSRVKELGEPFREVGQVLVVTSNNTVTIQGDFISNARDREFISVVEKDVPDSRGRSANP